MTSIPGFKLSGYKHYIHNNTYVYHLPLYQTSCAELQWITNTIIQMKANFIILFPPPDIWRGLPQQNLTFFQHMLRNTIAGHILCGAHTQQVQTYATLLLQT